MVIARSEAGASMVPVSWTEMQCPQTFVKVSYIPSFKSVFHIISAQYHEKDLGRKKPDLNLIFP